MTEIKADSDDDEVLALATHNEAVLITRDRGFGEVVFQQGSASYGVSLIRLAGVAMPERCDLLARAVAPTAMSFPDAFAALTHAGPAHSPASDELLRIAMRLQ